MCVICVKPAGEDFPSDFKIAQMFASNDDGAGFMFVRNNRVEIRKGFMKFKHFKKWMKKEELTKEDIVVMHFRIGTTGSTSPQNTHPFPVSDKLEDLRARSVSTDIGIAHNGILSYGGDKENDLSDTMAFIREVLSHKPIRESLFDLPTFTLIESAIGSSKMCFLNGQGEFVLLGDWKQDDKKEDKCFYSNLNFAWRAVSTPTSYPSRHGAYPNSRYDADVSKAGVAIYGYIKLENGVWVKEDDYKKAQETLKGLPTPTNIADYRKNGEPDWDSLSEEDWCKAFIAREEALEAEEKRKALARQGDTEDSVFVDYDDTKCPHCKYPIESVHRITCSKCGVFFYRPHEADAYSGYGGH